MTRKLGKELHEFTFLTGLVMNSLLLTGYFGGDYWIVSWSVSKLYFL